MAILAGVGPMGLAAINFVLRREEVKPSLLVVTDIDQTRLDRAASSIPLSSLLFTRNRSEVHQYRKDGESRGRAESNQWRSRFR